MAINKNHEFEELDGVKCGIVEKNVPPERVNFLKKILEYNNYTVIAVPTPAPKAPAPKPGEEAAPAPPAPDTFTVGVTDYTFNTINAIFGRLLKAPNGKVVTLAYWQQKEAAPNDDVPYFESA
jgi:hypothetical protein